MTSQVAVITTSGVTNDDKVGIMTTLNFSVCIVYVYEDISAIPGNPPQHPQRPTSHLRRCVPGDATGPCTVIQCSAIIAGSNFSQILTKDTTYLSREGEVCCVFCTSLNNCTGEVKEWKNWLKNMICRIQYARMLTISALLWFYHEVLVNSWWRHQMETFPRYWPFVRGIHLTKVSDAELGCFLWSEPE